jgi:hypothetical protein
MGLALKCDNRADRVVFPSTASVNRIIHIVSNQNFFNERGSLVFRTIISIINVLLLIVASGCATPLAVSMDFHEQHYSETKDTDKAIVYFYREKEFMASLRGIYVTANGSRIGALNNGTYFTYEVAPGKHIFSVEDWLGDDPTRTIDVEAGKKYYLKGSLKMGFWDAAPHLMIVHDTEGAEAVKGLKFATMK